MNPDFTRFQKLPALPPRSSRREEALNEFPTAEEQWRKGAEEKETSTDQLLSAPLPLFSSATKPLRT